MPDTMPDSCSFTGTKNNISDYALGAHKRVAADVVVVKNGEKNTEGIRGASWRIGTADGGAVKDYRITSGKGEVVPLSPEDLGQNPVSFKLWKNASDSESIRCSGTSTQGPITVSASMAVRSHLTGTFKDSDFYGPVVKRGHQRVFPTFSRELVSSFDLKLERTTNGTLGVIHLVKSKVTRIDSSGGETIIVDTGEKFVLYTPHPDVQDPVQNQVKVVNGALVLEKAEGPGYGFHLEILQTMENQYSYRFEEEYESYLFFKGNAAEDIWHPVGLAGDPPSLAYMQCRHSTSVRYNSEDDRWHFPVYKPTSPSFPKADRLPQWNGDIHQFQKHESIPVQQTKEFEPIATEQNVDELIPLLGLTPDAPELALTIVARVAMVNNFLRSSYVGLVYVAYGHQFANAKATTGDYLPKGRGNSWLVVWRDAANAGNAADHCTSEGFPVDVLHDCQKSNFVGGHVVWGGAAYTPAKGTGGVYIFPICRTHNHFSFEGPMQALQYLTAVELDNFFVKDK